MCEMLACVRGLCDSDEAGEWAAGSQLDSFCPLTDKCSSSVNKRQRLLQDFMSSIDQTGEFLALVEEDEVDEVKQERLEVRAEMCTLQTGTVGEIRGDCPAVTEREGSLHSFMIKLGQIH